MKYLMGFALLLVSLTVVGCKSAYVAVTVTNQTGGPVSLLEVDYPSASFGTETIAPGADFKYRLKIIGSGKTKVGWVDAAHTEHGVDGPVLTEGQEGDISITLLPSTATWRPSLHAR